jgi:2-dehydropantoate 2-reductase
MSKLNKTYILGAGAMGCLLAHELNLAFPQKILPTLLFRNKDRLDNFRAANSTISVVKSQGSNILIQKSKLLGANKPPVVDGSNVFIENLVISTKTYQTVSALEPYIPHLNPQSNILILQNGMGMASHLSDRFWPTGFDRPKIFQAISTHGAYKTNPTTIHHASMGKLSLAYIPRSVDPANLKEEIPDLVKMVLNTDNLNASYLDYNPFLLIQMEKLIVNACINPLSALMDCLNGDLLHGTKIIRIMNRVIREATECYWAEFKELHAMPEASSFLNVDRLLNSVLAVCKSTGQNSSSMREDVKHLNTTEVDWINGFIVDLGIKHRIPTPTNAMLRAMVKNKLSISRAVEANAAKLAMS